MLKKTTIKSLLDVQIGNDKDMFDLSSKDEIISVSLSVMAVSFARAIPILHRIQAEKTKTNKVNLPQDLLDAIATGLDYMLLLCNECQYDVPDEEELKEFEETFPNTLHNDTILSCFEIQGAINDIAQEIYMENELPIWQREEISVNFEDAVYSILACIMNIGERVGFKINDVLAEIA